MPARESYRKKAMACVAAAEMIRDPVERVAMLRIAEDYMKLADHVGARHDHGSAHRGDGDQPMQTDS